MSNKMKSLLCASVIVGASLVSVAAWSMGPGRGGEGDPVRALAQMSEKLDLSTDQQSKVKSLLASAKDTSTADRERMQVLRAEMMAMRDSFNADKARKTADEIGQITGRMVYQASETMSQIYQVLNAEQKAELDAMMAKRDENRGKRRAGAGKES